MAMTFEQFVELIRSQTVLTGDGVPSAALGNDFDYYVDQLARRFYRKIDGIWSSSAENVLGPYFFNLSEDQYNTLITAVIDQAIADAADQAVAAAQAQIADDVAAAEQSKNGAETAKAGAEEAKTGAETAANNASAAVASASLALCQGRLTLVSGNPVPATNSNSVGMIYFTKYNGKWLALWNGTAWQLYAFSQISFNLTGLAANTNFDVFVYDNAGQLTLETVAWSNDTTRVTALAYQDGIPVKSGAAGHRYVGTIRTTETAGQCEDSSTRRFVWNKYNQVQSVGLTYNTVTSWTNTTASWREYNDGTGQVRFECVIGEAADCAIQLALRATHTTSTAWTAVALDSVTAVKRLRVFTLSAISFEYGRVYNPITAGYHYFTLSETSTASGTQSTYGTVSHGAEITIRN